MNKKKWLCISIVALLVIFALMIILFRQIHFNSNSVTDTATTTSINSTTSSTSTTITNETHTTTAADATGETGKTGDEMTGATTTTTTNTSSLNKTETTTQGGSASATKQPPKKTEATKTTATTTSPTKTKATIAQQGGSYIDPRVEVGTAKWTSFAKYTLGNCTVVDKRTWGKQPTIEVYNDTCMRVTYVNKQGEKVVFQVEPMGSEYINRFTILDDGTYVSQLTGAYS